MSEWNHSSEQFNSSLNFLPRWRTGIGNDSASFSESYDTIYLRASVFLGHTNTLSDHCLEMQKRTRFWKPWFLQLCFLHIFWKNGSRKGIRGSHRPWLGGRWRQKRDRFASGYLNHWDCLALGLCHIHHIHRSTQYHWEAPELDANARMWPNMLQKERWISAVHHLDAPCNANSLRPGDQVSRLLDPILFTGDILHTLLFVCVGLARSIWVLLQWACISKCPRSPFL